MQVKVEGGFDIRLPNMVPIKQKFQMSKVDDVPGVVEAEFGKTEVRAKIKPGMKVAVAVGSRGIHNLKEIVACVVREIKRMGGEPFIVPAMGSHGGATAEGQAQVLADYGIIESSVGCPIRSSMETVQVGHLPSGIPLYFDQFAYESDAIVAVSRVKPHTDFKGTVESGLQKMIVIGLGKHKGASYIHSLGFDRFHAVIPEAGKALIARTNMAVGVAIIENARDETAEIVAVPAESICETEPELLIRAKAAMPKLLLDQIDVLVVEEIGKNISGSGMDPNIVGRTGSGLTEGFLAPPIQKIVVRDLTDKTHGNAAGIGIADIITAKVFNKIDFGYTYANCITSTALLGAKIPVVLRSDKEALAVAVKTSNRVTPETVKIVWIQNTLKLERIYVSDTYLGEIANRDEIVVEGEPVPIEFDHRGQLATLFQF
ncbi:hypothetical protein SD70_13520 [Gordoniibacillus kamchatkensis]|uniref:LarA-like N-terminal domain-containing protein n=1 Tax=Gordoniibacillus kamchatkensis TaxID=1590651 RepID=A0ABR5AHF8_9BACL|nr:hypothetical protein SD70_13520 [Paenibacillus sp. VKM B-2647]